MSCYNIYFKNFDFDKLKNISKADALNRVSSIVHADLHEKLNRAAFASAEEAKKAMDERERDKNNILKALIKISDEMHLLGFVGDFREYLKETEEYLEIYHQYTGKDRELNNIIDHYSDAVDDPSSGWLKAEMMVYSNFMYNENRSIYIKLANINRDA